MTLLAAQQVVKRYEGASVNALNGVSLQVESGEFYSFLGPSGCGKTTLLRIIAGFEDANAGSVLIDGKVMNALPAHKRPVNMVFQSYALFPHLSVFDNIAFGLKYGAGRHIANLDIVSEVEKALDIVRLKQFKDRKPDKLSGGQQQRVALARALAVRPLVLLLDEPLSALDVQIREEMQVELSRLQKELNMTFVMVTHDQSEALALSSRIAVFNHGNIEQIGSPTQVYEKPETLFVASFIGDSNVLAATLVESDQDSQSGAASALGRRAYMLGDGQKIYVRSETSDALPRQARLIFKPEALHIAASATGASDNQLRAIVKHLSYQGSFTDLVLSSQGFEFKATLPSSEVKGAKVGETLLFAIKGEVRVLADE